MRTTLTSSLGLVALVLAFSTSGAEAQASTAGGVGSITGVVTDPQGAVIQGAQVEATNELTKAQYTTGTDVTGTYRFSDLALGNYSVRFAFPGFKPEIKTVTVSAPNVAELDIKLAVGTRAVIIGPSPAPQIALAPVPEIPVPIFQTVPLVGGIAGKVVDPSPAPGAPIQYTQVTATNESTGREYITQTDPNGIYSLSGLAAGNYKVRFAARGFRTEVRNSIPVGDQVVTQLDVTLAIGGGGPHVEVEPWPASGQADAAGQAGHRQTTGAISGTAVDPSGAAIEGVQVTLTEDSTGKKYPATTDCAGTFHVEGLTPGSYSARFEKKWFRTENRTSLDVSASLDKRLDLQLRLAAYEDGGPQASDGTVPVATAPAGSSGMIRGRVVNPLGDAIPAQVWAFEKSTEKHYASTTTDSDGSYQLRNLPAASYCLGYDAGEWGVGARETVVASSSQVAAEDIHLPARRETVEVCTASCAIETTAPNLVRAAIALHLYAESNVADPGSPLWVTVTLTNTTKHSIVIPTVERSNLVFDYQILGLGLCGCPGARPAKRGQETRGDGQPGARKKSTDVVRIPPGGALTDRFDLSKLINLSGAGPFGPTYMLQARRPDILQTKKGMDATDQPLVRSNWITIRVMPHR